jgi:hypothetical protein
VLLLVTESRITLSAQHSAYASGLVDRLDKRLHVSAASACFARSSTLPS